MIDITIDNTGKRFQAKKGERLLDVLRTQGIRIKSPCGGKGTCKKCKVDLVWREDGREVIEPVLSCLYRVEDDLVVRIRKSDEFVDKKSRLLRDQTFKMDHALRKVRMELAPAGLQGEVSIADRMERALARPLTMNLAMLKKAGHLLGAGAFEGWAVLDGARLVDLKTQDETLLGMAIDIGTTTMVLYLLDLETGEVLDVASSGNPQAVHGADVISRISYASEGEEKRRELSLLVQEEINRLTRLVLDKAGYRAEQVVKATLCGNTTMMHLFAGVDPTGIAQAPYLPTFRALAPLRCAQTDIFWNPEAHIHLLPNIAGFVGADTVALILANRLDKTKKNILAVDLGTNGEIALCAKGKVYACSTAAGPAFEGASITFGMRADRGAVERLHIEHESIEIATIQDAPARGICGSGLIDAVHCLLRAGLITKTGKIVQPSDAGGFAGRIGEYEGQRAILLAAQKDGAEHDVWLNQKDIRELQLAKGAMLAGMQVLLDRAGVQASDLDAIMLAGAFGSYINTVSAQGISMFPPVESEKIRSVGNSAGLGTVMALASDKKAKRAHRISRETEYIELSSDRAFNEAFALSMTF